MGLTVIGAGIGGLAVALALREVGVDCEVLEARDEHRQRQGGAFLNVAPNGMRALAALGLAEEVAAVGSPSSGIELLSSTGHLVARIDAAHERGAFGFANAMVRRSALHGVLLDAAGRRGIPIRWGRRLTTITERADVVSLGFEDGGATSVDAVIGADGVRSPTRRHVLDTKDPGPTYLGLVDLAGFCARAPVRLVQGPQRMVFGRHGFFGHYVTPTGEVWWFANIPHRQTPSETDLARYVDGGWRGRLIDLFADDTDVIAEILRGSDDPVGAWPICDLPTLATWHTDRTVLMGDAAHASSPSAGQGASLALEDAVTLAALIHDHGPTRRAFAAFEQERRARTELAAKTARRNTSSKTAGPIAARIRDRVMPTFVRMGAKQSDAFMLWEPPTLAHRSVARLAT